MALIQIEATPPLLHLLLPRALSDDSLPRTRPRRRQWPILRVRERGGTVSAPPRTREVKKPKTALDKNQTLCQHCCCSRIRLQLHSATQHCMFRGHKITKRIGCATMNSELFTSSKLRIKSHSVNDTCMESCCAPDPSEHGYRSWR